MRTLLTIISVALGVGVVVAIDLAGEAATGSFESSMRTLLGATDIEIHANGGVDERWIGRLAELPVDARFAPVIESQATIAGVGNVPLYGIDPIPAASGAVGDGPAEEGVAVSAALARRLGLSKGASLAVRLDGRDATLKIAAIPEAKNNEFLVLDIADAQHLLGMYGRIDRIDVLAGRSQNFEELERAIRAVLPPGYAMERPGARGEENQRMLRAFRWNLRVLSYISLVVGAFLIYNTIAVSVVRRRPEIGVLRAIGTSRRGVLWLFLGESLLLGLAGAAIGVVLGRVLAEGAVGLIAGTVNSLFTTSRPTPVTLTWPHALSGLAAGMAVALISAFGPAREAMQVVPTEAMSRGAHEHHARTNWRRRLVWAAAFALLASVASQAEPWNGYPAGGYAAALLAIAAAACAAPAVILAVNRASRAAVRAAFGAEGMIAGRSLASSLSRSSVVVGALATAIAMMASVAIMVGSFRETVVAWLDYQLRADLYIRAAGRTGAGQFPPMPREVPDAIARVPGVAALDVFTAVELRYRGVRSTLGAGTMEVLARYGKLRFEQGEQQAILASLPGRDRAIVSEPFANRHGVRAGDRIAIPIGERVATLTVAGIYYEYSSNQGYVIVDRSTLLKYLPEAPPTNIAVYLEPGARAESVQRAIQEATTQFRIWVAPNRSLREAAIVIFDRTFAITWALEGVAILVAMLGAANSLLALVLDRRRELALLRYLGAAPAQIRRMILLEAGFLGALAAFIGVALGFVLSLLLIYVVNKQSFGWTIQFHPPLALLASAITLVWIVTVLAGLYPARVAARMKPIEVIHEE